MIGDDLTRPTEIAVDAALLWLKRKGKAPKLTETGLWRWTLPDPPAHDAPDDLPKEFFDRLESKSSRFPWLYATKEEAIDAAVVAIATAALSVSLAKRSA